ncbi:sel1 repeat family protein [Archangium violaceum]|uniref:tetratricopeptide repeat protein n=1 Tax=Archangium violaceum TaxID=83451 RepID=UPI00193C8578|nr:tetratricopeptide repeat protein [Archangium violaceum]QRK07904.1 sel1 repeat family protein [Archangium violaceum]
MRRLLMLALLSVVACSEKKGQGGEAVQDKATAALASKDEKCPGGTVKGCFDAAAEAERKGEVARAAELYTRVCDAGVARACTVLGTLVWQGRGVSADPARAFSLYMRACEAGDAAGCFSAGICHRTGACAEKNDAEASKLLRRACDGGDARACANLGGG